MSKFKYKFDNILQLREKLEDIKKREYAEELQALEKKKKAKKQIEETLKNNIITLKKATTSNIDTNEVTMYLKYQKVLKERNKIAAEELHKATLKTEDKRSELLDAMKSKKTLSVLKEKKLEQFVEEEKKAEQQIIDEIVSFAYSNNSD